MKRRPPISTRFPYTTLFRSLAGKGDASGVMYRNTGATAGHLVTMTALGAKPPRPVLTLQCHNNITELAVMLPEPINLERDRKSTRLNSSHVRISYAVFCLKK